MNNQQEKQNENNSQKNNPAALGKKAVFALVFGLTTLAAGAASATGLDLGVNTGYGVVVLGAGTVTSVNSGPITGSMLAGNSVKLAFSGGNSGQITGGLYTDGTATGMNTVSQLNTPPTVYSVTTAYTASALASAQGVSNYAMSLTPTQNLGAVANGTLNLTGNGGLNVISLSSLQNETLNVTGTASDIFVINVSGSIQTNQKMTLTGVNASQILWNLTGTSGNIFVTSGGDALYGTFLATQGGNYQFSNLALTGALINTAGNVQFVSGSKLTTVSFNAPTVPDSASTLLLFGLGASSVLALHRRYCKTA